MSLLSAENIHAGYGGPDVLKSVSISIDAGQAVGIIGPNGCGKSTLLRCLARLHKPTRGSIRLDGRDLSAWSPKELARFMAVVPQSLPEVPELTVRELVSLGRHPYQSLFGPWRTTDRDAVASALERCELDGLADRRLGALSGGERQRARIAMAVAQTPAIMLLDEPISFLDVRHQLEVLDLVASLNREGGMTAVMVLHDVNLAARYCGRMVAMREGRVLASGISAEVANPGVLSDVFDVSVVMQESATGCGECSFYRRN